MKHVYLLGSLNCDLTVRAPYIPERGETLKGSDFMMTAGGKGANQAYACANLGGRVSMAGAVGKDAFGDLLLDSLKSAGAHVTHVRRVKKGTGVAVITVVDGDNRIILDEGANGEVTEADAEKLLKYACAGDIFLTQLETPLNAVIAALKLAKKKGMFTVLNPAPANAAAREAVQYADLITPNRKELKLMSGKEGLSEGCDELLALGAGEVIVTLGEEGSLLYSKNGSVAVPCMNAGEAVDTTGAGDTYCGALCVKLAEGASLREAAHFATASSAIAVTRRGAQVAIPTRAEVEAFLKG